MTGRGKYDPKIGLVLLGRRRLTDPDVFCLTCWLMNETLNRSMVLFDAAGLAAALMAAPIRCSKRDDVTSVMPVVKRARNSLRFNWPKMRAKSGEHAFPYVALELNAAIRGRAGTSSY